MTKILIAWKLLTGLASIAAVGIDDDSRYRTIAALMRRGLFVEKI